MTKETFASVGRALFQIIGALLVGHNIFGHPVDPQTWETITGAAAVLGSMAWGIYDHSATIEQTQSALHSGLTTIMTLAASWALVSGQMALAIVGLAGSLMPVILSWTNRVKVKAMDQGQLKPEIGAKGQTTGKVVSTAAKILIVLFMATAAIQANAQYSPFSRMPHLQRKPGFAHTVTLQLDSTVNAFRFGVVVPAYAVTGQTFTSPQAMAGGEYGYKHMKYTFATQTYYTQWSINLAWFALNTATPPTSISGVQTFAALVGIKNDLIQGGPMINPSAPKGAKIGAAISIGIALH